MRTATLTIIVWSLIVFTARSHGADKKANGAVAREIVLKDLGGMRDQIAKQVSFATEYLLLFQWTGAGDDKLSFAVDKAKDGPVVVFSFTPGKFKNKKGHVQIYAILKNASWRSPENKRVPEPTKINSAEELAKCFPDAK